MRNFLIPLLAASFFAFPALADVPAYDMVKDKSSLKFIAIQNNAPVEGQFANFTTDIHFDPNQLEKSSVTVEVDTGSVTASNGDVASNVKLPEWLSTQAFPKATFKCAGMTRMPMSDNYYAKGTLTLRGKTVPTEVNFIMEHFDDKRAIAKGYATLRRSDFGIGQGEWAKDDVIKNEVRVEFRIVADKK